MPGRTEEQDMSDERSDRVRQAELLASRAHAGQRDKLGADYMDHVRAVASAVRPLGEDHEITALLHDTIEDCPDRSIVSLDMIGERFGMTVRDAVDRMTKRAGEDYKDGYLRRVAASPISRAVKLADIAHNRGRLDRLSDASTRERLHAKYRTAEALLSRS